MGSTPEHQSDFGGLGPPLPREPNPDLEALAKKVAARHSGSNGGIVVGKDGKLSTDLPTPEEDPPPKKRIWPF